MFSHTDLQGFGDPTGIAVEEGELLYGLIRTLKPTSLLETGTNIGVSASYMAIALRDNGAGKLTTLEHDATVAALASNKLTSMGLAPWVNIVCCKSADYFARISQDTTFDFVWLDTELSQRYRELLTLFPRVTPGGIICIHDLWIMDHEWFGGVPPEMQQLFCNGDLRALTLQTDHGLTVFQKRREKDCLADIFRRD
jgi:predicted O-methyltransferase YrrM